MNTHERRRALSIAVSMMEEVVADVLRESQAAGEPGLTQVLVCQRARWPTRPASKEEEIPYYHATGSILIGMAAHGEAVNTQPGPGPASWTLADPIIEIPQDQDADI